MATCHKCKKEFSDEFAFCPFCGTKKREKKLSAITNYELITLGGVLGETVREEFFGAFPNINAATLARIVAWLAQRHDEIIVYAFQCVPNIPRRTAWNYVTSHGLLHQKWSKGAPCRVKEKPLVKGDLPFISDSVFFTREEAEKALRDILEERDEEMPEV